MGTKISTVLNINSFAQAEKLIQKPAAMQKFLRSTLPREQAIRIFALWLLSKEKPEYEKIFHNTIKEIKVDKFHKYFSKLDTFEMFRVYPKTMLKFARFRGYILRPWSAWQVALMLDTITRKEGSRLAKSFAAVYVYSAGEKPETFWKNIQKYLRYIQNETKKNTALLSHSRRSFR